MRKNALKTMNTRTRDYNIRNFKCLSLVLLRLYDSHHRTFSALQTV